MAQRITLAVVGLLATFLVSLAQAQSSVIVEVQAGEQQRSGIPVSVTLPEAFANAKSVFMQRIDTGQDVLVQRSAADPASISWMLQGTLPRGQTRRYRVLASTIPRESTAQVSCRDTGNALVMAVSGRPVLTYHTAVVMPPQGLDPVYQRSGFIHPVNTPRGSVVTSDFPADHAHQHGIFFAWKQTEFEGRPIDFWNQAAETATVEHVSVNRIESGPIYAEFDVSLKHVDLTAPEGPKPVLNEDWTIRLYARGDVFVFDLTSRQQCASASPLTMLEYHYGGMGYRGPVTWLETSAGCRMVTSEGKEREEGNHSRPIWVDCLGGGDGRLGGVRIIQHPDNFRYPQPVRLHPSKPYFVFAPEVLGEFSIEPEQTYESRYRYVVFDGTLSPEAGDQLVQDYTSAPVVRIVE